MNTRFGRWGQDEPSNAAPANVLVYDTETNGLLDSLTKIHCLCLMAPGDAAVRRYHDQPELCARDGSMAEGLAVLAAADERWAHNGIGFDEKAIRKVYPDWNPKGVARDSLIIARTVWPDQHLKMLDATAKRRKNPLPGNLIGRHSLEAWGHRLKDQKGQKPESWEHLTPEMVDYCCQDVVVLELLRRRILAHNPTAEQIELEQAFAPIVEAQVARGFRLDQARVLELVAKLTADRAALDDRIKAVFPDFRDVHITPKKKLRREIVTPFNPGSRAHIARALTEMHGWRPAAFTPTGQPQIDEAILSVLPYPEAKLLAERFGIQKTLGTVAEGEGAWLKVVKPDGRVHGYMAHNAAVTSRCTHSKPNLGNIDTRPELRRCWVASPGNKLVVGDASGLEARIMGHYAARFDGGELAKLLLEGDVHAKNQELIAGVTGAPPSRTDAKRVFYGILYGAQDKKVGLILGRSPVIGKKVRDAILAGLSGLGRLITAVQADAKARGWLKTLDGRRLWVRSQHAALNTLVQGGGAICMKRAIVDLGQTARAYMVAFVHDEIVLDVPAVMAEEYAGQLKAAIIGAGEHFNLRVPLDSKVVIGDDWSIK